MGRRRATGGERFLHAEGLLGVFQRSHGWTLSATSPPSSVSWAKGFLSCGDTISAPSGPAATYPFVRSLRCGCCLARSSGIAFRRVTERRHSVSHRRFAARIERTCVGCRGPPPQHRPGRNASRHFESEFHVSFIGVPRSNPPIVEPIRTSVTLAKFARG